MGERQNFGVRRRIRRALDRVVAATDEFAAEYIAHCAEGDFVGPAHASIADLASAMKTRRRVRAATGTAFNGHAGGEKRRGKGAWR